MTYAELIAACARTAELPETVCEAVLKAFRSEAASVLAAGGEVKIPGLGTLITRTAAAHQARTPAGRIVDVPERRRVKFRASEKLTARLSGSDE
jgi:nucleoid DNA-binding protein